MIDKDGIRQLCYVVKIDSIEPIPGRDRVECARVGGWTVMTRLGQFKAGDLGIYFEIDSKVPAKEPFMFLEGKHFKIKTQKYKTPSGHFWSQGLLMSAEDFGWTLVNMEDGKSFITRPSNGSRITSTFDNLYEGDFLTAELGVTYADADDNKRKAKSADRYKLMAQRRPDLFKKKWAQWMMRRNWGKKVMFLFFGKKKDKKSQWPAWVVKTDEERVQNMSWILEDKSEWFATEKVDGTSTTFTMKGYGRKRQFLVCSRNVVFDKPDKQCFYETNVYTEMAEKYDMEHTLECLMEFFNNVFDTKVDFVTVQGETYGAGIQKRDYGMTDHKLAVFNVIYGVDGKTERLNPRKMTELLAKFDIPCVPIVDEHFILPDTVEELLNIATDKSAIDGGMREGLVFRSEDGTKSFKAVSNEFLMKFHS